MSERATQVQIDVDQRRYDIELQRIAPEREASPLLVFLHEGLGSVAMWRDYPQRLCEAGGYRGLVYSRPGYGRSTPRAPDECWPLDFMQRQAREILPAVLAVAGIDVARDPPWLFGHSDGGSIALIHAASFPRSVRGAIVLAPHLFVEALSVESIAKVRQVYRSTELRAKLARYHDDVDSAFYGWNDTWLNPAFADWNIAPLMTAIRCPILAIQGENDEYGTMAQIDTIAHGAPRTELLKMAACGHSPHRDQPDAVTAATLNFIHRHPHG